ncbi:MAG: PA2779 family protein [Betaproteobacteria bacterium]
MKRLLSVLAFLALSFPASAGMIATPAQGERERVKAMLERPELAAELEKMGIAAEEAAARVDAMNDAEVLQLAGRLDAATVGGQVGDRTLLLILLIILLILII